MTENWEYTNARNTRCRFTYIEPVHLYHYCLSNFLLAIRIQCDQFRQSIRWHDWQFSLPGHRTIAAANSQNDAKSGHNRRFADRVIAGNIFATKNYRLLHLSKRILRYPLALVSKAHTILRRGGNHIELFVRVTPNASRDEIIGVVQLSDSENRLAVKVRAVPEKGKANKAVIKYLAKQLLVPKSSITVTKGSATRQKTLHIVGVPNAIILSLENLLPE